MLEDKKAELKFREQLMELYEELIPLPSNENSIAKIRATWTQMNQKQFKGIIFRYCDLPSILGCSAEYVVVKVSDVFTYQRKAQLLLSTC